MRVESAKSCQIEGIKCYFLKDRGETFHCTRYQKPVLSLDRCDSGPLMSVYRHLVAIKK